jgi:thioredoxin reductase (NADPH)
MNYALVQLEKRARENEKIHFIWNTVVEEINGDEKVKSVTLKNLKTGDTQEFVTDGIFIFIGHIPNSDFLGESLEKDSLGYIVSDRQMRTNIEGVFTAGEISDPDFRQVVTSAGMGAAAAIQATRYLEMKEA